MTRIKVTRDMLRYWFDLPRTGRFSLGLPCGTPSDGEEDVVLYVDIEGGGATAGEAKPTTCPTCKGVNSFVCSGCRGTGTLP